MGRHEMQDEGAPPAGPAPSVGSRLRRLFLRTRVSGAHALIVLLCVAVGFAVVLQVRQTHEDAYASMRQDDLVRLLDELTTRNRELAEEGLDLRRELAELESGSTSRAAAREAAAQQAKVQGILAGVLPVHGPGVEIAVEDPGRQLGAPTFVTVLEELRNAGAEAIELNGERITASSWLATGTDGLVVSGVPIEPPYTWLAIGGPQTMATALDIPGGAMAAIRRAGAEVEVTQHEELEITSIRALTRPQWASPVPTESN